MRLHGKAWAAHQSSPSYRGQNVKTARIFFAATMLAFAAGIAHADAYTDAANLFRNAGQSKYFFEHSYGYAVFPTIGKGGLVVGAAHGSGRVFVKGVAVGDVTMTQLSVGLQAGGQAYSQIIFLEDERAFREFSAGQFEFGADASAVAITAGAQGSAGTQGASAGAQTPALLKGLIFGPTGAGKKDATNAGNYYKGMVVFTIVKGGAMYQAALAGQKFRYTALGR